MKISKKKLVFIIIGSYLGLNLIVSSIWFFVDQKINTNSEPDYTKILTEQEIDKLIDDTVFELDGKLAKKDHTDNGEFNMYSASFSAESLDIELNFDDMTKWNKQTMKTFTNDPDVIWEDYIMKSYYKMVKMFAESAHYNFMYYEDSSRLTKIMDYDVEVKSYEPFKDESRYGEAASSVIGNYKLRVLVQHKDETAVFNNSEPRLKIFMDNLLKILKK